MAYDSKFKRIELAERITAVSKSIRVRQRSLQAMFTLVSLVVRVNQGSLWVGLTPVMPITSTRQKEFTVNGLRL